MCGIASIYAYRESAPPVDEGELLRIREAMIHREEHRHAIQQWRTLALLIVMADHSVVSVALDLSDRGVSHYDALHAASAMAGKADVFVTTDDRLIKKMREVGGLPVMLPGEALAFLENWYEN